MPRLADRPLIRRAYSLLELLIVVAILVTVVGLSWPAVQRPAAKSRLQSAAKQLRVALLRARLDAIESGAARQFRFQPGTPYFQVSGEPVPEGAGLLVPAGSEGIGEGEAFGHDRSLAQAAQYELPDGVRFFDPSAPDALPGGPEAAAPQQGMIWSAPIVFYPNGRTFNARIRLRGDYDYCVDVMLRGLTGASRIGEVRRLEESREGGLEPTPEERI